MLIEQFANSTAINPELNSDNALCLSKNHKWIDVFER